MSESIGLPVYVLLGAVADSEEGETLPMQLFIAAEDEEAAVADGLQALSDAGYLQADLDEIGRLDEAPQEEPFASAYRDAEAGEVGFILAESADEDDSTDIAAESKKNPFAALKDWKPKNDDAQ